MCKAPSEQGGPYRCSADMRRNLTRAAAAADTAHIALRDADRALAAAHPADRAHAREMAVKASSGAAAADRDLAAAHANYDATPQGVADLQHRIDNPTGEPAPDLPARLATALARMNREARDRQQRWDLRPAHYVPIPALPPHATLADRAFVGAAAADQVTSSALRYDDTPTPTFRVTLTRHSNGDPNAASVHVLYPSAADGVSLGRVLADISTQAAKSDRASSRC